MSKEYIDEKVESLKISIAPILGRRGSELHDIKLTKSGWERMWKEVSVALSEAIKKGQEIERENTQKDMLIKMKEWQGTGTAMVNDYFALTPKEDANK